MLDWIDPSEIARASASNKTKSSQKFEVNKGYHLFLLSYYCFVVSSYQKYRKGNRPKIEALEKLNADLCLFPV